MARSSGGGKPMQQGGGSLPKIAQQSGVEALPEERGGLCNGSGRPSIATLQTAAVTRGRAHEGDLERGVGIDFYSIDNPLVLASWASFFRDQYIAAVRQEAGSTTRKRLVLAHHEPEHHQRNIFHQSPPPAGEPGIGFPTSSPHHGMPNVSRTNNPYCSPLSITSSVDPRHYPAPHAAESEQQEAEYHHHPSVQYLISSIIKSQAMIQSSDVMEAVFRRFPFWCGRAFTEAFYSAAMIGLRWLPIGPPYTAESFNTHQWRDFLCQDHGFQRFAERRRKLYLGRYAKDIASIAGLYHQSHPKQGTLLLEALQYIAKSSRIAPGTMLSPQQAPNEYDEAYNTVLSFYGFLCPRYTAFSRFDGSKPIHKFLSFEGEGFALEVVLTSLEEIKMTGEPPHQQQQKVSRQPSPSWHRQEEDYHNDRNPLWHEGRALSFQRTVEDFHTKKREGESSAATPPVIKSFDVI